MSADFASFASEHLLITLAAYVSLAITLLLVLWVKVSELLQVVWTSVRAAVRGLWGDFKVTVFEVLDFREELRHRKESRTGQPAKVSD